MSDFEISEALASLEMLMSEFFAPTTNNFRKREIENMLENFSNNRDSWKHCLLFLQKSDNQYVLMFILTTLEKIINKQWVSLSDNEKTEIRLNLMNELMTKHETMLYFIRNKLAALLVSIARYDWPHLYPDFFSNIVELLKCEGHQCIVGLVLAQAASEELGAARDTGVLLLSSRRSQLERLMLKGMPQMLAALSAILEKNAQKEGQSNPPPSPTRGLPQTSALPDLLANAHDVHSADKALNMEIVVKCLTTLQHLFLWLPLSSHVPPSLVTTVFYWGSVATQSQSAEAALAGLGGVCELLYRRYAPPSSAATALRLQHCALRLLRHLTQHPQHMQRAHQDYLNKLAEFLKLFVSLHFKRLEAEPEFDAIDFLSYLFQYTFQVPTCSTFVSCLDIWIQFIDVLKPEDTPKYWEALQALVNGVLNKIQFQHNKAQLQHLDNDVCDDDGETEWQKFLKHCIECIARVADLAPLDVFTAVMERWQCLAGVHARASGRGGAAGEADRLLAALLDLATLTRVLGRLAPSLLAEPEHGSTGTGAAPSVGGAGRGCAAGAALVERCASALAGAALTRPHRSHPSPALARAHVILHAEMFACMGAWCCYASECGVPLHTMESLFSSALPFLVPHDVPEPPLLCHAAAHLLLSLSKNVKYTTDLMVMLGDLYNHAQRSLHYLEPKTAGVVREALVSLVLARGVSGAGGAQDAARALLGAWAGALATAGPAHALPPLTALLHAFADAPTAAKKIIAEGICSAAESALRMLCEPACGADAEITDFFLALFTALLPQLGNFAYTAIDVFLEVAQRGSGDGEGSLERLVECVRLGVEAGGGGVRVHAVLDLLHSHVLPRADPASPTLARAAHRLLASVLVHRWRYFFPHKCEGEEALRRTAELRGALTALGRALLQPDIELLRINLNTLDTLNTKWKLYHKAIFRSEFMGSVLTVLLSGLVEGGARALLLDEALAAVHAMAAVDFVAFRRAFLPHFLQTLPGLEPHHVRLLADFPPDTDLPTFTQNIQRLMNDVNCYRTYQSLACNTMGS
ncbi:exportin-6-A [Maniola jurtina]|uniref:exportin-6-A n=1 Tax=Maniola jurtina TaxID=191418 RepID=UPI001E68B1CD|nr:exportin-6-A [Maniola jurtina]XP_045773254.1 exportin-6-A [Maniola jurtina]